MNTEYLMFLVMSIANIAGGTFLLLALFSKELLMISKVYKVAILMASFGLFWQAFRNIYFLTTGVAMLDTDFPLWYLKDLGWVIMGSYFAYLFKNKELNI
jgi:hypothetical protein